MVKEYNGWTAEKLDGFEEEIRQTFLRGEIRYPVHFSKGNSQILLDLFAKYDIGNDKNWIFASHRNHFSALLKGIPPEWLKSAIMRGNSMHLMNKEYKFFASSIVGGSVPIAVGVAMAIKRQGLNGHVWCFLGDMAGLSGIFYESLVYSQCNELPIDFVIEDNSLSTNSPTMVCWGTERKFPEGYNVHYYKYERLCPHINCDVHVEFH